MNNSYSYSYNSKNEIKFINKLHDYVLSIVPGLPLFYIIKDIEIIFTFDNELSIVQKEQLDDAIKNYIPPTSYIKTTNIQSVNITVDKVNSLDYISVATIIYNPSNLNSISIVSNINSSLETYKIRIYDCTNNKILSESPSLSNNLYELTKMIDLQNIPINDTFIEVQIKVSNINFYVNIKAIDFNFGELVS